MTRTVAEPLYSLRTWPQIERAGELSALVTDYLERP